MKLLARSMSLCLAGTMLFAVAARAHDGKSRSAEPPPRVDELRETASTFFRVWLAERNPDGALDMIAPEAFRGSYLLSESCAGYVRDEDRGDPSRTKAGALAFFRDFGEACDAASGAQTLSPLPGRWLDAKHALNATERDRFAVVEIPEASAAGDENVNAVRKAHPEARLFYVLALLALCDEAGETDAPVLLVLAQDTRSTKIATIDMVCQ